MHWLLLRNGSLQACTDCHPALQFGFSVYTTFRAPLEACWLDAHLERLQRDADALDIPWHLDRSGLISALHQVVRDHGTVVRLTIYPDLAGYEQLFSRQAATSRVMISIRPLPETPSGLLCLKRVDYQRPLATVKHGSMLEAIHLRRLALQGGCDDALFVNQAGNLAEASTANLFLIRQGSLLTPDPERDACLPGLTRQRILHWAKRRGVPVSTEALPPSRLNECEGLFLSNAVSGARPVARVDELEIAWNAESRALLEDIQAELAPSPAFLRGRP